MAHQGESVEVSLALTLSNLISLVSGPSEAGWRWEGRDSFLEAWMSPDWDGHRGSSRPQARLW